MGTEEDPENKSAWIGWISGLCVTALVGGLIFWMLDGQPRSVQMAWRNKCAENMKQVATACQLWISDHKGAAPQSLDVLVGASGNQKIRKRQLQCPECKRPYILVRPGPRVWAGDVLLYDPPGAHGEGGGNVAYRDGHVSWISSETLAAQLKATRQRQSPLAPMAPH